MLGKSWALIWKLRILSAIILQRIASVLEKEGVFSVKETESCHAISTNETNIQERNDRMKVLDVFSWLPAKEISIEELEQIFIGHLNGTYEGEYKVLLEVPDNADKNILNSRATLIEEGKDVACILKGGNVIAVVGYRE